MSRKITLDSGLRIITVPQKQGTQAVTILILVATGSKYEKEEENGISHFIEHMLFKGTKKHPSSFEISEILDEVGGAYNAFTSEDYTGYWAKVRKENFDLALDWLTDIFFRAKLESKEIEKEKGVVIEEINMIHDDPMSYIGCLWQELLYPHQPAGRQITGSKKTVAELNREKIINYLKAQYVGKNTIVCLSGNLEEKEAMRKVKKSFSRIGKKESWKKVKVIEAQREPAYFLETRKTEQTHFCLGARGYNSFHPWKYNQALLAVVLGGMTSSRLFEKVREKMGAAYYIYTAVSADPDTGFLVTQAGVDNAKLKKVIAVVLGEYGKVTKKKISAKELKRAKEYLKGRMTLSLESSDERAIFYGLQELLEKKILTLEQIFAKIDKVTAEDILKTAQSIFIPEKLNLALIGPFEEKSGIGKLLKI